MGFSLQTTCSKCGKAIEPSNMRAIDGGKRFVCMDCFEETGRPIITKDGVELRSPVDKKNDKPISGGNKTFFEYKEWVCDSCKYRFKRNPEFVVSKCPFCGKSEYVHQVVDEPAQNLLN
ncbi:MAG: hypothetical protein ACOCQQ_00805 [Candidatus Nanoarchaeia archaeon]